MPSRGCLVTLRSTSLFILQVFVLSDAEKGRCLWKPGVLTDKQGTVCMCVRMLLVMMIGLEGVADNHFPHWSPHPKTNSHS